MLLIPGYTYVDLGPDGGIFDETKHPKGCIHTTEGTSLQGAENAFKAYPPHLGYDPARKMKHQYVSLDRYSYAFRKSESDDECIIQVEIVGFARDTHNWPDEWYRNIGEDVIRPLRELVGIPSNYLTFYGEDSGIILASPNSPIRLTDTELRNYSGWIGHQHVPAPDEHWDPGKFNILKALQYSESDMTPEEHGMLEGLNKAIGTTFANGRGLHGDVLMQTQDETKAVRAEVAQMRTELTTLSEQITSLLSRGLQGSGSITFHPIDE